MKMFEVNLNEVPAGLDQKAFIKHPALKKINWIGHVLNLRSGSRSLFTGWL